MNSLNINSTMNNNLMIVKIVLIFSLLVGFSQPELQIHLVSCSIHCQHLTFHIFQEFFGIIWSIPTKLGTEHPLVKGIIYFITNLLTSLHCDVTIWLHDWYPVHIDAKVIKRGYDKDLTLLKFTIPILLVFITYLQEIW